MKLLLSLFIFVCFKLVASVDFIILIPQHLYQENGIYQLDYSPPIGSPAPNTTILAKDVHNVIPFLQASPGTKYHFTLYFSNLTISNLPAWQGIIHTSPNPPTNLSVAIRSGKTAVISWSAPSAGDYHGYRMEVVSLSEAATVRTIALPINSSPYSLKDLTPGGTYFVQLFSVHDNKESTAYISRNFTTKPSTPGKFIVWFRNETTLLVLWQPSYPVSIFSHYKVSIDPPDAPESILYVKRESEPPGPAQAAFKSLVPGRAYNISVQTVSQEEVSAPTTAQYRTIPLGPLSLTYDNTSLTSQSVRVTWEPPKGQCDFEKYQISVKPDGQSSFVTVPITQGRDEPTMCDLSKGLKPGRTYQILVKTVSAKVTSQPATVNVTLKPLPVIELISSINSSTGHLKIEWRVDNSSYQEFFKISYMEAELSNGDNNTILYVNTEEYELNLLLPDRIYSISVQAVSNQMESNKTTIYRATRPSTPVIETVTSPSTPVIEKATTPSAPVIEKFKPTGFGWNISWNWTGNFHFHFIN